MKRKQLTKGKKTTKNNDEKLKKAYADVKADIANLLGWFECELEKERTVVQWGWVGSLNKVRDDLIETLSFMSGLEPDLIKMAWPRALPTPTNEPNS